MTWAKLKAWIEENVGERWVELLFAAICLGAITLWLAFVIGILRLIWAAGSWFLA